MLDAVQNDLVWTSNNHRELEGFIYIKEIRKEGLLKRN